MDQPMAFSRRTHLHRATAAWLSRHHNECDCLRNFVEEFISRQSTSYELEVDDDQYNYCKYIRSFERFKQPPKKCWICSNPAAFLVGWWGFPTSCAVWHWFLKWQPHPALNIGMVWFTGWSYSKLLNPALKILTGSLFVHGWTGNHNLIYNNHSMFSHLKFSNIDIFGYIWL